MNLKVIAHTKRTAVKRNNISKRVKKHFINDTEPLLDAVFIFVIFFMAMSNMSSLNSKDTPESKDIKPAKKIVSLTDEDLSIKIHRKSILYKGKPISIKKLKEILKKSNAKKLGIEQDNTLLEKVMSLSAENGKNPSIIVK